jgi:serine/threonine-protein kinase RsbW
LIMMLFGLLVLAVAAAVVLTLPGPTSGAGRSLRNTRRDGRSPVKPTLAMTVAADPVLLREVRSRLRRWLAGLGWPDGEAEDIVIAVNEAVSNAIEHAYAETSAADIDITARAVTGLDGARVIVRVADHGRWRPAAVFQRYRGHGIGVVHSCMDRVEFQPSPAGTTVVLTSTAIAPPPRPPDIEATVGSCPPRLPGGERVVDRAEDRKQLVQARHIHQELHRSALADDDTHLYVERQTLIAEHDQLRRPDRGHEPHAGQIQHQRPPR